MALFLGDLISFGVSVTAYVLTALALYTIAKRRGIKHPWLAWIPVADMWLLGCISDQYHYVVKGQVNNRRKTMLTLNIVWIVLLSWAMVMLAVIYLQFLPYLPKELSSLEGISELSMMSESEQEAFIENLPLQIGTPSPAVTQTIAIEVLIAVVPAIVSSVCMIIHLVLMFKCYYDVFLSAEPMTASMHLTLSIVGTVFGLGILRPIFVFMCRHKDDGMPPRGGAPIAFNALPDFRQVGNETGTTDY